MKIRNILHKAGVAFGAGLIMSAAAKRSKQKRVERLSTLKGFEMSLYSQNGEDGVLKELLFRVGFASKYFVEFGVGDGSESNAALLARYYRWNGLFIEGNPEQAFRLAEAYSASPGIVVRNEFITAENIAQIFSDARVPEEFDVLSIDIDGNDYWVWKALGRYRPRIVVIEYNAKYRPPERWIMDYNADHVWDGSSRFGASLEAYEALAADLGYSLVYTESRGVNAFFVRTDLAEAAGLACRTAAECYHPARYGMLGTSYK